MQFDFTVSGVLDIEHKLQGIKDKLSARDNALYQDLSTLMRASIEDNFSAEGRPAWEERKYSYSHPILDKTGTMRDIAEMSTNPTNWQHSSAEHRLEIMSTDYAKYHQDGKQYADGFIVRKFVKLTDTEESAAQKLFDQVFEGA